LISARHWRNIAAPGVLPAVASGIYGRACSAFSSMRKNTMWKKPEFVDLRLGLEVTLYISNR
jgi:coenzyme PQQ precursor peptide PqqA